METWDADGAADWFADLFAKTRLAERIVKGLDADLEDEADIVRSAARLVVMLARPHVWPVERVDEDVAHALARLEALVKEGVVARSVVQADIETLRARVKPPAPKAPAAATLPLLWTVDLATPAERKKPPAYGSPAVRRLAPVGPMRWVAGTDRHLKLFDDRGKVVRDLSSAKPIQGNGEERVFATTSDIFVCSDGDQTMVCSTKTGELRHRWEWKRSGFAASAAVAADGSTAIVLTKNGKLNVLDLRSGRVRHRLAHPARRGSDGACAIGPEIAASSWDEAVRLWDLRTGKQIGILKHPHRGLEMTPDGTRLLTYTPKGFAVWNVATGKRVVQRSPVENTPDPALVLDLQTRLLRPRGPGDIPHFTPRHSAWLDAHRRVTTQEPLDDQELAIETAVLLHRLGEAQKEHVIARGSIALPRKSYLGRMIPDVHVGRVCRIASTHDLRVILIGDRHARVYAFGVSPHVIELP